jgi:hypothetical protein
VPRTLAAHSRGWRRTLSDWEPLPRHPDNCPWLTEGPDGDAGYLCGQERDHEGDHTWWAPGHFPFPPLLHPLDLLRAQIGLRTGWAHCPNGHGAQRRAHCSFIHGWRWLYDEVSIGFEPPPTFIQDQWGQDWEPDYVWDVEFRPCGCRFRVD